MSDKKRGRPVEWSSKQYAIKQDEDCWTREQILKLRAERDATKGK